MPAFSNPSDLKNVFEKLPFRDKRDKRSKTGITDSSGVMFDHVFRSNVVV